MNNTVSHYEENCSYNPLFIKMRERFCADGTIAEKMAVEAGICKKRSRRASRSEYRTSLPHAAKMSGIKKAVFSLKSFGAASMGVLVLGTLLLSGASFDGIHRSFTAGTYSQENAAEKPTFTDTLVEECDSPALYFADESIPDCL